MRMRVSQCLVCFFFFNHTATTEIYTLSLHDALPISGLSVSDRYLRRSLSRQYRCRTGRGRSEEHTSELQSHHDIVCRILLEKKKKIKKEKKNMENDKNSKLEKQCKKTS